MTIPCNNDIVAPRLKVAVVGCGGAGNNVLTNINLQEIDSVRTIALNTDASHLLRIKAQRKLLLGREETGGRGSGGNVPLARKIAERSRSRLSAELEGSDLVFILAGMGGGTGTGFSPVVASVAKDLGALAVSITSMPFDFERGRIERAKDYVRELMYASDSTVILENNRLLKQFPHLTVPQAFRIMDVLTSEVVSNVTNSILKPSLVNIDYADLKTVFRNGKLSTMIFSQNEDADMLVRDAIRHPMLQADMSDASGALVHVSGGRTLTLEKTHKILKGISDFVGRRSHIIMGARQEDSSDPLLSVTAVVTGLPAEAL